MTLDIIGWTANGAVRFLDQTRLPQEESYEEVDSVDDMIEAIKALRVRGAPLIGIAAAMGLAAAAARRAEAGTLSPTWFEGAAAAMADARPTAVNLTWAVNRMRRVANETFASAHDPRAVATALREEAQRVWNEDADMCRAIGEAGADVIPIGATVLTHCNAGALATGGIGTAVAALYTAHEQGKGIKVISTETRPLRQGARLTAWELSKAGVPVTAIVDSAAAFLMAKGGVDLVITGADRIAANGDVANKIGTYALAVLARAHDVPFYVAAPRSTFDLSLNAGSEIPIEERAGSEVDAAGGARVYNPAFDVTPAELVGAIVTDRGIVRPPYRESIRRLFD
jgi:methylthioribose-1-phosphate isomerase